jgi:hypothetical protein
MVIAMPILLSDPLPPYVTTRWSPDYFSRLWCCFEVAVFDAGGLGVEESHNGGAEEGQERRINVVPLEMVKLGFLIAAHGMLGVLVFRTLLELLAFSRFHIAIYSARYRAFEVVVVFGWFAPTAMTFRVFAAQRRELNRQLQSFSSSEASCFSEDDRELLHGVISENYRRRTSARGDVGAAECNEDDGIARFDADVQTRILKRVNSLLGPPSVIPPKFVVLFASIIWMYALDSFAARAALPGMFDPQHALSLAAYAVQLLAFSFGFVPLAAATANLLAVFLHRKREFCGELAVHGLMIALPTAVSVGGSTLCHLVFHELPNEASIPVNMLMLGVTLALTTVRPGDSISDSDSPARTLTARIARVALPVL